MKNIFIVLLLWAFHLNVLLAQNITIDTLVYGGDSNYPPYEFLDKNGEPQGYNIDLIKELAKVLNLQIKIKLGNWPDIKKEFEQDGTIHITDMFYSISRDRYLDFALPHEVQYDEIFVRNDNKNIESFEDLKRLKVIVQEASYSEEYFSNKFPNTELILVPSEPEALIALSEGKGDAALISSSIATNVFKTMNLSNIRSLGFPILPREYCFVVTHENSGLLRVLNKGILELKINNKIQQIEDRWFGNPYKNFVNRHLNTLIFLIGFVAVLLLSTIFFLRRLVRHRTRDLKYSLDRLTLISKVKDVRLDIQSAEEIAIKQLAYIQKVFQVDVVVLRLFKNNTYQLFGATGIDEKLLIENITLQSELGKLLIVKHQSVILDMHNIALIQHTIDINSISKDQYDFYAFTHIIFDEIIIGSIEIISKKSNRVFSDLDLEHMRLVADQLAVLLQNKNLFDQNANQKLQLVKQIESRKSTESDLKKTGKLLQKIIDNTQSLIYVFSLEHKLILTNLSFQKLFNKTKEELVGLKREQFMLKEVAVIYEKDDLDILRKKDSIIVEEEIMESDGLHYYLTNKFPLQDDNGKIYAICCISTDITQLKKIEEDLLIAKDKAEESNRLKSAFLANMSHEIRTPMNGIIGFTELLKNKDITASKQQKFIDIIEKSGQRLLSVINDIIDISKIESGQMKVTISKTFIDELFNNIYSFFKPEVENKGMKLKIKKDENNEVKYINTDQEKIYAILTNLIKNAIKYSKNGYIEYGYHEIDKFLQFYVKDTGIGIPKDRQEAIFERFVQADIEDRQVFEGAGLGLSISKAFVEMLGGKIWVLSEEGKGSTFYFTIPYK